MRPASKNPVQTFGKYLSDFSDTFKQFCRIGFIDRSRELRLPLGIEYGNTRHHGASVSGVRRPMYHRNSLGNSVVADYINWTTKSRADNQLNSRSDPKIEELAKAIITRNVRGVFPTCPADPSLPGATPGTIPLARIETAQSLRGNCGQCQRRFGL